MSIMRRYPFIFWLLLPLLFACQQQSFTTPTTPRGTRALLATSAPTSATATASPAAATVPPTPPDTATPSPAAISPLPQPTWPPAVAPLAPFASQPLTADEVRTATELAGSSPPARDDLRLAREYHGITELPPPAPATPAPTVGTVTPLNVLNIDNNTVVPITVTLLGISEHAYFWFDNAYSQPEKTALLPVEAAFDQIYETGVAAFGAEVPPAGEADARIHIVHAAPAALCEVADQCSLAGYFSPHDSLPRVVNAKSNERKMFVMNAEKFGTGFYLNVLAHELRHLLEDYYDPADIDWEVEGSAMMAEELAGFTDNALSRGNAFLAEPDQQLNRWTDGSTYTHYGQGYVLNRYIYDRLGPDLYRAFATNPADGLAAVTAVAEAHQLALTGEQLWQEWLAALAIHAQPEVPARYRLGNGALDTVTMREIATFPATISETVHQFAADYYHIQSNRPVTLSFQGSRRVPLLPTAPPSGRHFWYANRANYSHPRLTIPVDLRPVLTATLSYSVWYDIEYGYDFAYLSVSDDGGERWTPLVAQQMQGQLPADNPAGKALAERFYTGQSNGWLTEEVDLSAYAGKQILLRFSYITDPILTFGGLALDNIAIPAIGLYDGAENAAPGWQAEGFTRATPTLPQKWHLQVITLATGGAAEPVVTPLTVNEAGALEQNVPLGKGAKEAILIVGATAPLTLEEAVYRLRITD